MKLKNAKKNSGFTLVELLVVIAIIAGLAAISSPIILRQIARSRATQAINNAKDIYVGLRDFAFQNTRMPGLDVANANLAMGPVFIAGNIVDEKPFFVNGVTFPGGATVSVAGAEDAVTSPGPPATTTALDTPGENVYAYYGTAATATGGIDPSTSSPIAPVLSVPTTAIGATFTATTFDPADFSGQAVVLFADGGCASLAINTLFNIPVTEPTLVGQTTAQPVVGLLPLE